MFFQFLEAGTEEFLLDECSYLTMLTLLLIMKYLGQLQGFILAIKVNRSGRRWTITKIHSGEPIKPSTWYSLCRISQ